MRDVWKGEEILRLAAENESIYNESVKRVVGRSDKIKTSLRKLEQMSLLESHYEPTNPRHIEYKITKLGRVFDKWMLESEQKAKNFSDDDLK